MVCIVLTSLKTYVASLDYYSATLKQFLQKLHWSFLTDENSQQIIVMLEAFNSHWLLFSPKLFCVIYFILNLSEAEDQNVSQCIKHWNALLDAWC